MSFENFALCIFFPLQNDLHFVLWGFFRVPVSVNESE